MHDITLKAVKLDVASNYIPFEEGLTPYLKNHFLIPFSQRCTSQVWLKLTSDFVQVDENVKIHRRKDRKTDL